MLCISAAYAVMRCLSVRPSVCLCVCHVRGSCQNEYLQIFLTVGSHTILVFFMPNGIAIFPREPPPLPNGGVECRWCSQKSRFWAYLALVPAVGAATCQVLSKGSPVDDGHRLASYDTSLVVSGGVDCGRRRRNVYDKKPRVDVTPKTTEQRI